MEFCRKLLFLVLLLLATSVSFGQWKIATPRQVLPVPSDGSTVNFPNVNLISGMKYRVHASGLVTVSNKGETADACYYISAFFLYFPPTTVPVSFNPIVRLEWPAPEKLYLETAYVSVRSELIKTLSRWHLVTLSPQAAVLR